MKKRIAVFGCGWSNEYLMVVNEVFTDFAMRHDADLFYFINYSNVGADDDEEFDAVLSSIKEANLPTVCLGYRLEGVSCFECNNYSGMYELVEHLVTVHGVQDILYIGGPKDNQESLLREKALTDVLQKYGYSLKPENILCGNWNYFDTQYTVKDWYEKNGGKLPDAIVCANDVMAMGTYVALAKAGVSSLSKVIVTGFDDLISARMFSPGITSVNPGWEEMARQAMEHLFNCIKDGNEIVYRVVQSHSSIRESCGCCIGDDSVLLNGGEIFLGYERMVGASYLSGHMCELADALSVVRCKEDISKFFEYILTIDHFHEGNEFYLCFVDNFFDSLELGEKLVNRGFPAKMELIGGIRDNKVVEPELFDTKQLLPSYNPEKESVDQYLIVCLSSRKECYGYVVMVNNTRLLFDYALFVWSFNMGQNIERLRQNLTLEDLNQRLAVLSVTDALTGVYNRMGCEKVAFPLLENCYRSGKNAVLLFLDINKMKIINDNFGHEQGDVAIRMTANAIQLAIPDDWVVVRYGGDEFLIAGECESEQTAEYISERIQSLLVQTTRERKLPYPISVGIGAVYVKPEDELDLYRCLRIADAKMYQMKKEHGEK